MSSRLLRFHGVSSWPSSWTRRTGTCAVHSVVLHEVSALFGLTPAPSLPRSRQALPASKRQTPACFASLSCSVSHCFGYCFGAGCRTPPASTAKLGSAATSRRGQSQTSQSVLHTAAAETLGPASRNLRVCLSRSAGQAQPVRLDLRKFRCSAPTLHVQIWHPRIVSIVCNRT